MARRATRLVLPIAIGLALLGAALAGHRALSSREPSRAPIAWTTEPAADLPPDAPALAPDRGGMSDRNRLLAWAARHKGCVSFDPVERFLEDKGGDRAWHDDHREIPDGEVTAVRLLAEDLDRTLADLPGGVTVPVLELPSGKLTPAGAAHLLRIRGLRCLYVHQDTTDAAVAVLGRLSELEYLLIDGESLTDESLAHLGRLQKLRHLGIIAAGFRGESGASCCLPATLENLYISARRGLDDRFVTTLPPLPNLVELHLPETWITDVALPKIGTFHALRELDLLNNPRITDAAIGHLAGLQKLQRLDLSSSAITDEGFAAISKLQSLKDLRLRGTRCRTLPGAASLTRLQLLDLGSSAVTDEGLGRLVPLGQLAGLYLSNTKISDASLASVGAMTGLRSLDLGETRVTSAGLVHLQGLGSLEELDLWKTSVGNDGMRHLATLRSLRTLDVDETGITPDGLLALKDLPNLRGVQIRIGPAALERLKAAMPECAFGN